MLTGCSYKSETTNGEMIVSGELDGVLVPEKDHKSLLVHTRLQESSSKHRSPSLTAVSFI